MSIHLRPLGRGDLAAVAGLHRAAFPEAAMSRLGPDIVERYYLWLMYGPHDADGWGAFEAREMVGFCFSGIWRGAEAGFVRDSKVALAAAILRRPWLVWSPFFRKRIALGFRLLSRPLRPAGGAALTPEHYGVQAIATDVRRRRHGIGRLLMANAERRARERGFRSILLTVHAHNTTAIEFYLRLGWEKVIDNGVWRQEMRHRLD
ncbi:MAG: hypothetical protein RIR76_516 [Verrucomicrobiota bacterium]|jgi:ribosomal protein S18 acetylase RimI-like enzyme